GTIAYAYDSLGRKSAVTYPGGDVVRYEYDAMDRLVAKKAVNAVLFPPLIVKNASVFRKRFPCAQKCAYCILLVVPVY
ncbi:MAG: RHS repeat protein, partial [Firmicutes bacterium]|nr:RHS repeat protein [Bacillota bacterium]